MQPFQNPPNYGRQQYFQPASPPQENRSMTLQVVVYLLILLMVAGAVSVALYLFLTPGHGSTAGKEIHLVMGRAAEEQNDFSAAIEHYTDYHPCPK